MATFLSIVSHTAADCAAHNAETRRVTLEGLSQMEELTKKHGVKVVGAWSVHSKHFQVVVYDAPNFEAIMAFSMEPPIRKMMGYSMSDVYPAMTMEEMTQMLMRAQ